MVEVWYDAALAAHSVAFFSLKAGKPVSRRAMLALAYAADRLSLEQYGFPVVDDIYMATTAGPVGRQLLSLLSGEAPHPKFSGLLINGDSVLGTTLTLPELDQLSVAVTAILDRVWESMGEMGDGDRLAWLAQHCPEWDPESEVGAEISLENIARAIGIDDWSECVRQVVEFRSIAIVFAEMSAA